MTRSSRRPMQHSRRWQLFSLLVGPIGWSVFFVAGYLLVEASCQRGFLGVSLLGVRLILWLVAGLSLLTLALIGYGGWRAYTSWRRLQGATPNLVTQEQDSFMALAAVILALLFGLSTITTALSVLVGDPCAWV